MKHSVLLAARFISVCLFLLAGTSLFSQVNTGRILGSITDQTGGAVAGAMVTLTNTETGVSRSVVTDAAGEYLAPNLAPGTYAIRVTTAGFQAFERQNIPLTTGKDLRIDAQLVPGQVTQTVTVEENVLQLDTSTSTVTGTLDATSISDLPINGRNYQNLLSLRPGVTMRPGGGTLVTSTNGLRPEENNYYVEGLDVTEPFTGQSIMNSTLPSGDAATFIPVDAIREVTVETNAPAEFGRRPGAVINAGIKGGTNSLRGSAYAFGRSDKLNATDYFITKKQPTELEQWGGTLGGPILKNKLFYFGGFERQTYTVGVSIPFTTPSLNPANLDPSQSIPAAEAVLASKCPNPAFVFCNGPGGSYKRNVVSNQILPLWAPTSGVNINQNGGFPATISIYNLIGKLDYHLNDHHSISGSYFFGNGQSISEDGTFTQASFLSVGHLRSQFVTTTWTWTPNSTWVNDLRFGWDFHHRQVVTNDSTITSLSQVYGINTGVTAPNLMGFPQITFSGKTSNGFTSIGGDSNLPKNYGPTKDYDIVDHVSYLRGTHAFKFGGELIFTRPYYGNFTNGRGVINFAGGAAFPGSTTLEDFLAGVPDPSANSVILNGDAGRQLSQQNYSVFLEDNWRAFRTLTLNLGIRYEYFTPLKDSRNLLGGWDPAIGLEQVGVNESAPYPGYKKDFSPRLGLAWDIAGKGKTVFRAGGGIFYASPVVGALVDNISLPGKPSGISSVPTGYFTGADGKTPPLLLPTSGGIGTAFIGFSGSQLDWSDLNGPIFPASAIGPSAVGACGDGLFVNGVQHPSPCSILVTGPGYRPPRVEIWNVGLQQVVTRNMSLEVNYVGDHSGNLIGVTDVNAINPANPLENVSSVCPTSATAKPAIHNECITHRPYYAQFPYLQFINVLTNIDRSNYNALQSTLTVRGFHGLGFVAAYTYAHSLDDNSSNRNQQVPMNNLDPHADYGPSSFDHRNHFSISGNYSIPGKKGYAQLLQGWKINTAIVLMSGTAWTPTAGSQDISKTADKKSDRWDFIGNPADFKARKNATIPFFQPDPSSGPKLATVSYATDNPQCVAAAQSIGTAGPGGNLASFGCYVSGNSVLLAPPTGTFGTATRGIFRNLGYFNTDLSLFKDTVIKERFTAQFRAEFFNALNHPNFSAASGNPGSSGTFGCACNTPDQAGQNPVLGSGGARVVQIGLKLLF